jgi:peptidoglycan/LPS O-acetylase OafA/YrhL
MFVVLAFFGIFVKLGKPMPLVPLLFLVTIIVAALLGDGVARFYSEPLNRRLRQRWGDGPERLGAALETQNASAMAQGRG